MQYYIFGLLTLFLVISRIGFLCYGCFRLFMNFICSPFHSICNTSTVSGLFLNSNANANNNTNKNHNNHNNNGNNDNNTLQLLL